MVSAYNQHCTLRSMRRVVRPDNMYKSCATNAPASNHLPDYCCSVRDIHHTTA